MSTAPHEELWLVAAGAGWELVTRSGEVVFQARGRDARRACLRRAQAAGTLRLHPGAPR
jgi:hypothetical protein